MSKFVVIEFSGLKYEKNAFDMNHLLNNKGTFQVLMSVVQCLFLTYPIQAANDIMVAKKPHIVSPSKYTGQSKKELLLTNVKRPSCINLCVVIRCASIKNYALYIHLQCFLQKFVVGNEWEMNKSNLVLNYRTCFRLDFY